MSLSHDDVQEILRLLDTTPYDELRLETARFRLCLRRTASGGWVEEAEVRSEPNLVPAPGSEGAAGGRRSVPGGGTGGAGDRGDEADVAAYGLSEVRAPLVGVFYRAPKPGAAPFVEVGSPVEPETVVGIVETMKLMNPVYAGVRGTVVEICLADAEPAGQDAVLMRVRPEAS